RCAAVRSGNVYLAQRLRRCEECAIRGEEVLPRTGGRERFVLERAVEGGRIRIIDGAHRDGVRVFRMAPHSSAADTGVRVGLTRRGLDRDNAGVVVVEYYFELILIRWDIGCTTGISRRTICAVNAIR